MSKTYRDTTYRQVIGTQTLCSLVVCVLVRKQEDMAINHIDWSYGAF